MSVKRLLAIIFILLCTTAAWVVLGTGVSVRSGMASGSMRESVSELWGPPLAQPHPEVAYDSPASPGGKKIIPPAASALTVALEFDPKRKGLWRYRTYQARFRGVYQIENPTPITQTLYVRFRFPAEAASYTDFAFALAGTASSANSTVAEGFTEAVTLAPGERVPLEIAYTTRGSDTWLYTFGDTTRVRNFHLAMTTNFTDIDFPPGTSSADSPRERTGDGYVLEWSYPDRIGAQAIGMAMPKVLNPGPVAARIAFFAPVSLLFFFAVLVIMGAVRGVSLHPMNYFFLAAGMFAFHLLFTYTVDWVPVYLAFAISAGVSMVLVSGYLTMVVGWRFGRVAAAAQFAYMVLFSYSFFFDGLTGLTITIGAIVTLAMLMVATARINWAEKFSSSGKVTPPPMPAA